MIPSGACKSVRKMTDEIIDLLQCPNCGGELSRGLDCEGCGKKYSRTNEGIYDLVIEETGEDIERLDKKLVELIKEEGLEELQKREQKKRTKEMMQARQKWGVEIFELFKEIDGKVLEIASGPGGTTNRLIRENVKPIITDINLDVLRIKNDKMLEGGLNEDYYMAACDAKNIPIKDNTLDYVVSVGGLTNIPNTSRVISEIYRVLKKGGNVLASPMFVEEGSKSAEKARESGLEDGVIRENLENTLSDFDFEGYDIRVVSSAEGVKDDLNVLQTEGELQYYSILTAEK